VAIPEAEPNRVRPEHWIAFIVGDVAAIAAWVVTRQLPLAVLIAGLVYVVVYLVARRRE